MRQIASLSSNKLTSAYKQNALNNARVRYTVWRLYFAIYEKHVVVEIISKVSLTWRSMHGMIYIVFLHSPSQQDDHSSMYILPEQMHYVLKCSSSLYCNLRHI